MYFISYRQIDEKSAFSDGVLDTQILFCLLFTMYIEISYALMESDSFADPLKLMKEIAGAKYEQSDIDGKHS